MAAEAAAREPGLRERNKKLRQDAVVRAAYRLFAERGYDATTVADIAAAAEVAPRTVAMYFPSKQDIALSRFGEAADEVTLALRQREPGETVPQVLDRWLRTDDRPADREIKQLSKRLFAANPELSALRAARMRAASIWSSAVWPNTTTLTPASPAAEAIRRWRAWRAAAR